MTPSPIRPLAWLLGIVSSRDAADAAIGDVLEELGERTRAGRRPRHPALWVNLHTLRAIALESLAAVPRRTRSAGLILRDAVRAIRAAPAHSLFVVFVLAAGITLATVTFSVVDAVVLKPLPFDHPERLVTISTRGEDFKPRITPDVFWRLHDQLRSAQDVAARQTEMGAMITVDGTTDEGSVTRVTADIFRLFQLSPVIGRLWTADDEAQGDTDVAVLGYRFWREQLDGDPTVLGKTVSVDGRTRTFTVIGVLSAASDHPEVDLTAAPVWTPIVLPRTSSPYYPFGIVARVRPGVSTTQVADEVQRLTGVTDWRPDVKPVLDIYVSSARRWMLLALGAAALVVLVACANAANLMLSRSAARAQEMAIRASLGASRRQIALAVLAEGLLLSVGATTGALLLSVVGIRLARVAVLTALPRLFRASTIALNGRVFAAAIVCAITTGVLCSLVPAWQTSRAPVSTLLKDTDAPAATGRRRWRSVLLVAEVATVVVLLAVSWLFVMSLIRVDGINLGVDYAHLIAVNPRLRFRATVDEVERRIELVPGVSSVAVSTGASLPLVGRAFSGAWWTTTLQRANGPSNTGRGSSIEALQYRVTPNYFAVTGLPLLRGRTWRADPVDRVPVVVLEDQAARQLFGQEDPIGQRVRATEPAGVFTVVGIVPHVYARGPEETDPPEAYFAVKPNPTRTFASLFVRTSQPPEEVLPVLTKALEPVGPDLKEPFVFTADDAVRRITATRRFNAELMSVFGLAGILIGAAGVYAVMASFVAQQTREIGVRVALGATPARIQRGVLALAWRHLAAGLAVGVPVAWWLSRGFTALLFQVTPADASVYVGVGTLLTAVGVLAAWIPSRRAARVDPIISLRR